MGSHERAQAAHARRTMTQMSESLSLILLPPELLVTVMSMCTAVEDLVSAGRVSSELRIVFWEVVSAREQSCCAWAQGTVMTSLPIQPTTAADCLALSTDFDALIIGSGTNMSTYMLQTGVQIDAQHTSQVCSVAAAG